MLRLSTHVSIAHRLPALGKRCSLACADLREPRLVREYAVFFAYATFHVLRSAVLFTVQVLHLQQRMTYADYFYACWTWDRLGFGVFASIELIILQP